MAGSESKKKAPTQADIDAAEALGSAIAEEAAVSAASRDEAESSKKGKQAKKQPKKKAKKPAKKRAAGKVGDWSGVDQILAFVLLANLALMAVLVLTGDGEDAPGPQPGPESQAGVTETGFPSLEELEGPDEPASPGAKAGRAVGEPQHQLWSQALRQASLGNIPRAIEHLHALERDPGIQGVVRRTVYQQLAYYYGLEGNNEQAMQYQALATRGHLVGLNPKQLWNLATEAHKLSDLRGARTFYARFLLQQGRMDEETAKLIPLAYLRLANSYRAEADPIQHRRAEAGR